MFTVEDLANMRATQDAHMQDTCKILVYSTGTQNEYGEYDAPTYTAGADIVCGLDMRPGDERHGDDMTVIQYDATLRLPIATALKETDRIRVTHRYGENATDIDFEVVAPIQRGPSGIRVLLRKVVV